VLSSSPLEKFLSSQEALPSDCSALEVEGQDVARAEKDDDEEVQRVDNVAYDAGYGDLVADHLLSLIEGSVDHHASNDGEEASSSHNNDALGNVWRAPRRDDDSSDSDSEAGDDDDDEDGAYDFGPTRSSLSDLDPRSAAVHAASAREQGKQHARQQTAVAATAKAAANEHQRRATRRAAEMARRKALLGAHQV